MRVYITIIRKQLLFFENISEEEYQYIKNDIVENVMEFIKNERGYETDI